MCRKEISRTVYLLGLFKWKPISSTFFYIYKSLSLMDDIIENKMYSSIIVKYTDEKIEVPLFVISGSNWTSESNNVSCLYSYDGNLLGKMYKYSAFDNIINGVKYKEKLNNPGKEITLVKIPGIGICQTEICRNYYTQPSNMCGSV